MNAFAYKSLIENVNFRKNSFDIILCHGVLHHCKNYKKSLNKIFYILRKKGILFITICRSLPFILDINNKVLRKKIYKMPQSKSSSLINNIAVLGKEIRKVNTVAWF